MLREKHTLRLAVIILVHGLSVIFGLAVWMNQIDRAPSLCFRDGWNFTGKSEAMPRSFIRETFSGFQYDRRRL